MHCFCLFKRLRMFNNSQLTSTKLSERIGSKGEDIKWTLLLSDQRQKSTIFVILFFQRFCLMGKILFWDVQVKFTKTGQNTLATDNRYKPSRKWTICLLKKSLLHSIFTSLYYFKTDLLICGVLCKSSAVGIILYFRRSYKDSPLISLHSTRISV